MFSSSAPNAMYPGHPRQKNTIQRESKESHTRIIDQNIHTTIDSFSLLRDLFQIVQRRCDVELERLSTGYLQLVELGKRARACGSDDFITTRERLEC